MNIRILLADDHKIMREGLLRLLNDESDMKVIAEAENGNEVIDLTRKLSPDVVLMDVCMPTLNGIYATEVIRTESRKTKVIALSMYSDKPMVQGMIRAGASGYLVKDCSFDEMAEAIRVVHNGGMYLSSEIADIVIQDYAINLSTGSSPAYPDLTKRERQVLQLIAEGNSTRSIASELNVSVKTIEAHRRLLMDKLEIRNVAGLIKYALREGLTALHL